MSDFPMKGHGEKLSRNKEKAIFALISQPTMKNAAKEAGISEATLRRWLQTEDFQREYMESKRQTVLHATTRLRQSMTSAIDALMQMAENPKTPAVARASACRTLLEFAFKAHETEEMQKRIERLEEALEEDGTKQLKGGA